MAITSQNAAYAILKLVAADALPALMGNLVLGNLVNRDYEPILAQAGDVVNIPLPPVLTANNIAEAGTVTQQQPNLGNAQIVLNQHREATFTLPDVTKILNFPGLLGTYLNPAMITIAEAIETDILSLYSLFTANTAVGGASTMDEARIDSAETALFTAKVPQGLPKFLVMAASPYGAARQISRFTEYQTVGPAVTGAAGGSPMLTGDLPGGGPFGSTGKLKDFFVFRSQFVAKPSATYFNLAFARDAIGLAIRKLPEPMPGTGAIATFASIGNFGMRIVMSYQPGTLATMFTVDCLYGCSVLRNNFGIQVQST